MKTCSGLNFLQLQLSDWLKRVGHALVHAAKAVWTGLEYLVGDDAHWKVMRRLLAIAAVLLLGVAARYGWLANMKLDWLASLFGPLLGKLSPWSIPEILP